MARSTVVIGEDTPEVISTGYAPRILQADLHRRLKRFSVILCHRRFGKTVFAINHMIHAALICTLKNPRIAYIAPTYSAAKRIAWDYLKQYTANIPGVETNEAELRLDFPMQNGARIQLLSGENYASLKGIYLDYCVMDEYGDMNPSVWREAVRPALSDRLGGALFIGTVKGTNHFWQLYDDIRTNPNPEWYAANYKASETHIIDAAELESARRTMTEEEFNQEFENDPLAGLVGAYFAKELTKLENDKRVGDIPHDPMLQVDTYWDLGMNDTTAVWFVQSVHGAHRAIDYLEVGGSSIPDTVALIKKKGYNFGQFVLPHDAKVRDLSTGKSRVQTFYSLGCRNVRVIPRVGTKMEGINAARMVLAKCYFDRVKCALGLKSLANYQRRWDAKNNVFHETPLHNWASNGADAFQQLGLGVRESSSMTELDPRFEAQPEQQLAVTEYDLFRGV